MTGCYGTSGYYFVRVMEEALFFFADDFHHNFVKYRDGDLCSSLSSCFLSFFSYFLYTIHGDLKWPAVVLTKIDPYPGAEGVLCGYPSRLPG